MKVIPMRKPSYYAIIPAKIRYDSNLVPNEKLLFGEITALSNRYGYCWADNKYFMNLYHKTNQTITVWIDDLVKAGYLYKYTIRKGLTIPKRYLSIHPISRKLIKKNLNNLLRKKRTAYSEKSEQAITQDSYSNSLQEQKSQSNTTRMNKESGYHQNHKKFSKIQLLLSNLLGFNVSANFTKDMIQKLGGSKTDIITAINITRKHHLQHQNTASILNYLNTVLKNLKPRSTSTNEKNNNHLSLKTLIRKHKQQSIKRRHEMNA